MTKIYGYCRYSSSNQREQSIEQQQEEIKKYISDTDYKIVGWYLDCAISGKTADHRPQFLQMFDDIKKGKDNVKAVLVYKLDRFSRSIADFAIYTRELQMADVELISVTERLDNNTSFGRLNAGLKSLLNSYYLDNMSEDIVRGHLSNGTKSVYNGGTPPLGYSIENQRYILCTKEVPVVQLIFQMYDEGYSYG